MSDPTQTSHTDSKAESLIAGRYELKRRLAQGGMAEVWLAVDLTLDRKVAVKWLKPLLASDEVVAERFRREAIAAASLNHPNIVAVHDVFEHEGRQAVVMQLVDGKSLRQLLDTQKRLSPELTGHIGACTAAALHHAHENNFVHRDVKPGNIMITPDGRVLLTDFGIAKALAGGDDLTSENIMMGTAKYLSPEQVRGKKLDGRADLYSLGLVLYECLAGRVPFLGETDADTALARLQRDPTDLSRLRATLPTSLVTIIHQLLARNPVHRPATGADLVAALESAAAEGPPAIDDTPHEHSPVAPFSAGRLRRAPSDLDGRADDRRRATRNDSPAGGTDRDRNAPGRNRRSGRIPITDPRHADPRHTDTAPADGGSSTGQPRTVAGPRRIPGEPERITGTVPIQPQQTATAGASTQRDNTPHAGAAQRGQPAKGMAQTTKPSLTVLGGLMLLAAIVAAALWISVQYGGDDGDSAPETVLPSDAETAEGSDSDPGAPGLPVDADDSGESGPADGGQAGIDVVPGAGSIESIAAYDPDGDDGEENDDLASLARSDGDSSTNWRTSCYSDEFMGGKEGVGLVVTMDGFGQAPVTVDVGNGPYIVKFLTSANDAVPASFDGWDTQLGAVASSSDTGRATVVSEMPPAPVRHVLVLLQQLGRDDSCSDARPFRGRLGEIGLS